LLGRLRQMASVKTLMDDAGQLRGYKVRWRAGGRQRSQFFPVGAKGQADRFATTVEADKIAGTEINERAARMTVDRYAGEWLGLAGHREGSAARVAAALKLFRSMLGDRAMGKVRQSDIKAWIKARGEEVSPATVRSDLRWVRAMFAAAVADGALRRSPAAGLELGAGPRRKMVLPSREGVAEIAGRLPAHWGLVGPLGARTGLRPAELLGLCVEQIDFLRGELVVDRQMVGGQVKLEPKTEASSRSIPLEAETVSMLAAHLAAHPLGPPVTVYGRKGRQLEPAGTGRLVFHRPSGGPLTHRTVNEVWARHAARAGWAGVRVHDMRHFFASYLIREGADVVLVSRLLGHSRPSITADVYAHEFEDRDQRARELMARVWAPRAVDACPERVLSGLEGGQR
jgi:integrase